MLTLPKCLRREKAWYECTIVSIIFILRNVPYKFWCCIYEFIYSIYTFRRRQWHPTPVLLPGKSQGWRSLVGCSPWGRYESDMTEWLHFHFSLSCIGEGNGNPLQHSWLESPRDGGAWWAAIYGVTQSSTRLKWLSSSSSSSSMWNLLGPGIELVSPALVGRFFTTGPQRSVLFPFY